MTYKLTRRAAKELIAHEGIVREAYKDSVGVWTWSIGITNASGHQVHPRYLDNPQSLEKCLQIFIWLLKFKYVPDVEHAFTGYALTEAQFAAALSFHWNTGRIASAGWVTMWKEGRIKAARTNFLSYRKPADIIPRRQKEAALFFDGVWSGDGKSNVYPVRKPSYTPNWAGVQRVDVSDIIDGLLS